MEQFRIRPLLGEGAELDELLTQALRQEGLAIAVYESLLGFVRESAEQARVEHNQVRAIHDHLGTLGVNNLVTLTDGYPVGNGPLVGLVLLALVVEPLDIAA